MFQLQSVSLHYGGVVALDSLDLELSAGEQVCLIGPSGAGKSSLLGLLNGRTSASQGEVLVEGTSFSKLSRKVLRAVRSRIAWVPQDLGLVSSLRVHQNVACGRVAEKGFWGLLRSFLWMSAQEKREIPERARDLVALLTSLAKEEGITLIMSLHDVALARQFFDRVVGLREGRVVFDGRADEAGVKNLYRLEKSLPEMP